MGSGTARPLKHRVLYRCAILIHILGMYFTRRRHPATWCLLCFFLALCTNSAPAPPARQTRLTRGAQGPGAELWLRPRGPMSETRNEPRSETQKIKQHESTSQTSVALVPSSDALDSSGGTLSLHLLLLAWHLFLVAMHLILRAGLSHYTCYY